MDFQFSITVRGLNEPFHVGANFDEEFLRSMVEAKARRESMSFNDVYKITRASIRPPFASIPGDFTLVIGISTLTPKLANLIEATVLSATDALQYVDREWGPYVVIDLCSDSLSDGRTYFDLMAQLDEIAGN